MCSASRNSRQFNLANGNAALSAIRLDRRKQIPTRDDKLAARRARVMTIIYRNGLVATFALLKFSLLKREAVSTALLAVVLLFVGRGVSAAQMGPGEKLKVAFFGFE